MCGFQKGRPNVGQLSDAVTRPVRCQPKNYQKFFNENQLLANFPTYRAPPGTQHFCLEEWENTTPMWRWEIRYCNTEKLPTSFIIWLPSCQNSREEEPVPWNDCSKSIFRLIWASEPFTNFVPYGKIPSIKMLRFLIQLFYALWYIQPDYSFSYCLAIVSARLAQ